MGWGDGMKINGWEDLLERGEKKRNQTPNMKGKEKKGKKGKKEKNRWMAKDEKAKAKKQRAK